MTILFVMAILTGASPGNIVVSDTPLDREAAGHLRAELDRRVVTSTITNADLRMRTDETEQALRLVLSDLDGRIVLDRQFPLAHGRVAAFRALVLAVTQTLALHQTSVVPPRPAERRASKPPPTPPSLTPPPAPLSVTATVETPSRPKAPDPELEVSVGGGFATAWVLRSPQIGGAIHVAGDWGAWRVGAEAQLVGIGCCASTIFEAGSVALDGRSQSFVGSLFGERRLVAFGAVTLFGSASLGIERLLLRVVPQIFVGTPVQSEATRLTAIGRAGLAIRGPIGGLLSWRAYGGMLVRTNAPRVGLPAGFPSNTEDLEVGTIAPTFSIGLEARLF